jgi:hypothetical protein
VTDATSFCDLPASSSPLLIELLDASTRKIRWSVTVTCPGAVRIPGKHESNGGRPVAVRITSGDGKITELWPEDTR